MMLEVHALMFFDKDSVFLTVEYPKNEEELRNLLAKY